MLGNNVLSRFVTLLDFPRRQVTFLDAATFFPADLKPVGMDGSSVVPLTQPAGSLLFYAPVRVTNGGDTAEASLQINTGGKSVAISAAAFQHLHLLPVGQAMSVSVPGGEFSIGHTRLPQLSLGDRVFWDVEAVYPVGQAPPNYEPSLGVSIFAKQRILLDMRGMRMYLKPATPPAVGAR